MIKQNQTATTTNFNNMEVVIEPAHQVAWARLKYTGRPCMSRDLLKEIGEAQDLIARRARAGHQQDLPSRLMYQVLCSDLPEVFNLGGDLAYFIELIRAGNKIALFDYAKSCIDILYRSASGYDLPFTTIALVQGEALGGGFEAALSANVMIAERSARFGFPETVFGMFPGMGAFSFLARRIAPALAKRMIASGKVYTAEELYDMGVVDVLVPDGQGEAAVYQYIQHQRNRSTGFLGLEKIIDQYHPLSYKELIDVTTVWVDTAMQLSDKNIRLMQYLVRAQEKRWDRPQAVELRSMAG